MKQLILLLSVTACTFSARAQSSPSGASQSPWQEGGSGSGRARQEQPQTGQAAPESPRSAGGGAETGAFPTGRWSCYRQQHADAQAFLVTDRKTAAEWQSCRKAYPGAKGTVRRAN